jgi:hypothetical protein
MSDNDVPLFSNMKNTLFSHGPLAKHGCEGNMQQFSEVKEEITIRNLRGIFFDSCKADKQETF